MELTSNYLQIQKDRKKHPWLKDFLNNLDTVRYRREMDKKIEAISPMHKVIRAIPRQSGKTFFGLSRSEKEWLSSTEWHRAETSPVQINSTGLRVSASEHLMSDSPDITREITNYYARRFGHELNTRLMNALLYGSQPSIDLPRRNYGASTILPSNNDPSDNIRGIGARAIIHDEPMFFANQYMGEWVGDRHGDVPPIPYDPGE
ncbi:hypothetical protein ACWA2C_16830 [Priestia megaterium]